MHANCQGVELERLLRASRAFDCTYRIVHRTNFTREPVSRDDLSSCSLFLYQHLGEGWGELASSVLLAGLSPETIVLRLPNLFFKGYWPFWTSGGPIDFGDVLLNRLIDEGASKAVILRIYLHSDIQAFVDLQASLDETLRREREKEADSPIQTLDFFLERWKSAMQFHTINHPGYDLLLHVAQQILGQLDLPPHSKAELQTLAREGFFPSYANFDLPIHPQVAAFHNLQFGGPEQSYALFGRRVTFEQYISRYIDCRLNGLEHYFLGYLQLV